MNRDRGYLRTISCSISLSSCRVRAESLARALNSKLWPRPRLSIDTHSDTYDKLLVSDNCRATSCAGMANIIDKAPRPMDVFKNSDGYEVGHCWVNEMPPEDDESYDTPPCSSPPSPADDEIIVNPPSPLPFCGQFLRDFTTNRDSKRDCNRNHSIFADEAKLRDKLQQYAESLLQAEDSPETFYDASDNEGKDDGLSSDERTPKEDSDASKDSENNTECINSISTENETVCDETHTQIDDESDGYPTDLTDELLSSNVSIEVHPPASNSFTENLTDNECNSDSYSSKNLFVDRRLREVQELEADERPKLIRSTSLKTGKTPPGTPGRKKIVRFADVLGLDLEDVRHIVTDDLPHVPSSAFNDLNLPPEENEPNTTSPNETTITTKWESASHAIRSELSNLYPLFNAPSNDPDFMNRIRRDWVALESATVSVLSVHCVCRVLNVSYEKHITARYTTDDWRTWDEVIASYVPFSSDGEFDRFSFSLYMKPEARANQCLSFAVRYTTSKGIRWDNNSGQNYTLRCTGNQDSTNPFLPNHDMEAAWLHHFC